MASDTRAVDPKASNHRWRFFRAGGFDQVLLETGADLTSLEALDQKLLGGPFLPGFRDRVRREEPRVRRRGRGRPHPGARDPRRRPVGGEGPEGPGPSRASRGPPAALGHRRRDGRGESGAGGAKLVLLGPRGVRGDGDLPRRRERHGADLLPGAIQRRRSRAGEVGGGPRTGRSDRGHHRVPGRGERPRRRAGGDGGDDRAVLHGGEDDRGLVGSGREAGDPSVRRRHGDAVRTLPLPEAEGRGLFPAMPSGGVRRPVGGAAWSRGSRLSEAGRDNVAGGHGGGCRVSARGGGGGESIAPGGRFEPRVRRRGAEVRGGDRPAGPGQRGIACGRRVGDDLRALRAVRSVAGNETGDGGGETRRGAGTDVPRGGRQDGASGSRRAGQGRGAGGDRHRLGGAAPPVLPRPAPPGEQLRLLPRLLHAQGKATFQAGTLYLDGRSCDLCVPISDVAKHAAVATLSRVCLVYCDCVRRGRGRR